MIILTEMSSKEEAVKDAEKLESSTLTAEQEQESYEEEEEEDEEMEDFEEAEPVLSYTRMKNDFNQILTNDSVSCIKAGSKVILDFQFFKTKRNYLL